MKILHVNDMAGVAPLLCKYLRKEGHQADCISFMDDDFGFLDFYGGRHFQNQYIFWAFLTQMMRDYDYDILHLHFSFPILERLYIYGKPVVMHYHGSDLTMNMDDARMLDNRCKLILVAGEQLLQYHPRAKYLPTIVDTDHFKPIPELREGDGGYLTFDIQYLKQVDGIPNTTHIDRDINPIPYSELPKFLNKFDGYIDVKHHRERGLLTDRSKTALEALACGLNVVDYKGEVTTGLPERHKPENVVQQLIEYYEGILN